MAEYIFKTDKINTCKDCPCAEAIDPSYYIWCRLVLEPNTSVEGGMMWKLIDKKDLPKPSWCPLEEVPTPHGDLIDRQRLKENLSEWEEYWYDDIEEAPIVISASKE